MDAHELYGLPLERFVPERNALARSLRAKGKRDEGERVAGLRKPSVAAWAVNQIVRTQGHGVKTLFASGDAVQRAHADLLAGRGDAAAMRSVVDDVRAAVDELVEAARGLLSSSGHELSPAVLDRVRETLNAAALDADARDRVRDVCLERELGYVGLGGAAGVDAPTASRGGRRAKVDPAKRKRAAEVKAARDAEAAARRALERAERALSVAEARRDRAAEALRETEEGVAAALETKEEAVQTHRQAEQAVDELSA
jgi:hypothetical protein